MQVTIDIPEPLYSVLEVRAREGHISLEGLLLEGAGRIASSTNVDRLGPHISPAEPGILIKMGINLNDLALMTDDEMEKLEEALAIDPESAVKQFGLRRLNESE